VVLSIHMQQGVSIAVEWKEYTVSYYGDSLQSKLTSLRKEISRHKESMSHITASKICSMAEKQTIEKQVDTMNEAGIAKTEKVLRTASFLAKEDRPFSDHPHLLELQQVNGGSSWNWLTFTVYSHEHGRSHRERHAQMCV